AYVFEDNGSAWGQVAKLTASDGAAADSFGLSVSVSGTTAVVGAFGDDDCGLGSGSAYLFEKGVSGWSQMAKLTASDGTMFDSFGVSVAVSGTTAVVGAHLDDDCGSNSGSAYLFEDNGTAWVQTAKLTASDGAVDDYFGGAVSVSGMTALVAANMDDDCGSGSGSVYVFENNGTAWVQVAKLLPSDGEAYDAFGVSVAVSGTTAVVGAYGDDDCGSNSGSAYVFEDNGTAWVQVAKLLPSDIAAGDAFGFSVSVSGTTAVVGAQWDDDCGSASGSAYVFEDNGTAWVQVAKLLPSDGAADDWFGRCVSVSGPTAIVGAFYNDDLGTSSGSAYIFTPIPEPATLALVATGLTALVGFVRRRR
ncbi:MAG TPA: PEP-CTERM sorting domain-containing protein, partial [Planctomycetota bacterium]|nr:PEP-CTERM sorting domain-containing protein [Planctomycetota bacterium]